MLLPTLVTALVLLTVSVQAQEWPVIALNAVWDKTGITATPTDGIPCRNGTRLFCYLTDIPGVKSYINDFLMLYDTENSKLVRSFNKCVPQIYPNDSVALIVQGTTLLSVRLEDGSVIDSLEVGDAVSAIPLTANLDTVAVFSRNSIAIVSLQSRSTLSSGPANDVHQVFRIPGTDSIIVSYGYANHDPFHPSSFGGVFVSPINDVRRQTMLRNHLCTVTVSGRRLIRYDGNESFYDRYADTALRANYTTVIGTTNGTYVAIQKSPNLRVTILASNLVELWSTDLADTGTSRYVAWEASQTSVGIASDTVVWEINCERLSAVRKPGVALPDNYPLPSEPRHPIIVSYTAYAGLHLTYFDPPRVVHPMTIDGRKINELKPAEAPFRLYVGKQVVDLNTAGEVLHQSPWSASPYSNPDYNYAYDTDTWYNNLDAQIFYERHTFDTMPKILGRIHATNIVDCWLSEDGESYFAADLTGRVLRWDILTQEYLGTFHDHDAADSTQLLAIRHASDSAFVFVERTAGGKLVWGSVHGAAHQQATLSDSPIPRSDIESLHLVLIAGPSAAGDYYVKHPTLPFLFVIDTNFSVRSVPFRNLHGLVTVNDRNVLVGIDSTFLYYIDPINLRTIDSFLPFSGYTLLALEASTIPNTVLLNAGSPTRFLASTFRLDLDDVDGALTVNIDQKQHVSVGDGRTVLQKSTYPYPDGIVLQDINTGDTLVQRSIGNWLPAEVVPSDPIEFSRVRATDISEDHNSFVMLVRDKTDMVIAESRRGKTIHYHTPANSYGLAFILHQNGKYIELSHSGGPVVYSPHPFIPLAMVKPGLTVLSGDQVVSEFNDKSSIPSMIATNKFKRPLGSSGALSNIFQRAQNYQIFSGLSGKPGTTNNPDRFTLQSVGRVLVGDLNDGRILDTISVPFPILTLEASIDGRLLLIASYNDILIYDLRSLMVVGISKQFSTIEHIRWSKEGHRLFVYHDYEHVGVYSFDHIPLYIASEPTVHASCACTTSIEADLLSVTTPGYTDADAWITVCDLNGCELVRSQCSGHTTTVTIPHATASKWLLVTIQDHASTCTKLVPYVK